MFITNGGNQPNLVYYNQSITNDWIKIKCIGNKSNKSAIGAKLVLYQNSKIQTREIPGETGGYGGQNGLILHLGIGQCHKIVSLKIYWTSGKLTKMLNLKTKKLHIITEQ